MSEKKFEEQLVEDVQELITDRVMDEIPRNMNGDYEEDDYEEQLTKVYEAYLDGFNEETLRKALAAKFEWERMVWCCRDCGSTNIYGNRGSMEWNVSEQRWDTAGPEERMTCRDCESEMWAEEKTQAEVDIGIPPPIGRDTPPTTIVLAIVRMWGGRKHPSAETIRKWADQMVAAVQVAKWDTVAGEGGGLDSFRLVLRPNVTIEGLLFQGMSVVQPPRSPFNVSMRVEGKSMGHTNQEEKALHWFSTLFQDQFTKSA